jgi:hypothetical protein
MRVQPIEAEDFTRYSARFQQTVRVESKAIPNSETKCSPLIGSIEIDGKRERPAGSSLPGSPEYQPCSYPAVSLTVLQLGWRSIWKNSEFSHL